MQLITNKWLSAVTFLVLLASSATVTLAAAPSVTGKVVNKTTGEGIPGMVVRWEDNADAQPDHGGSNGVRYTTTGADGSFRFASWHRPPPDGIGTQSLREAERDKMIDTDYDGKVDTRMASDSAGNLFGCIENPHTFTLMLPRPGYDGTFEPQKIVVDLDNARLTQSIGTFYYTPTKPQCPSNIKYSCNTEESMATVSWDVLDGVDGYKLYYDRSPFHDLGEGDDFHPLQDNSISRTFSISLNTHYTARVRSIKQGVESDTCFIQFTCSCTGDKCGGGKTPPTDDPTKTPPPQPKIPDANLVSCINQTDPYYRYHLQNINLYSNPFKHSRLMVVMYWNSTSEAMVNDIGNYVVGPDFSQWVKAGRGPRNGDAFGYYLNTFTTAPASNTLSYQITDSTKIGAIDVGTFRKLIQSKGWPTTYEIKADMTTTWDVSGELTNDSIVAPTRIDFSQAASALCKDVPCTPGNPECKETCPTIDILGPTDGTLLAADSDTVTISWTVTGGTAEQYEVLAYDMSTYKTPGEALNAVISGTPTNVVRYITTETTQQVSLAGMKSLKRSEFGVAVRAISASATPCVWTSEKIPLGFTVTGRFYTGESCVETETVALNGRNVSLSYQPEVKTTITGDGTSYSLVVPYTDAFSSHTLQLNLGNPPSETYICSSCNPEGNQCKKADITETNNNVDFYVHENYVFTESWWNVYGGQVYASGNIKSELPNPDGQDLFRFIKRALGAESNSLTAGLPITNTGSLIINGQISERDNGNQLQVRNVNLNNISTKPDYDYFVQKLSSAPRLNASVINSLSELGTEEVKNNVKVYHYTGSVTFNLDQPFSVGSNEHKVVLVNGDLIFSSANLDSGNTLSSVTSGGTIMFVAKNKIIVSSNVGNSDSSSVTPNLEGIFIGREIVVNGGEDKRFVGKGSFYGWQNVSLNRQYNDIELNSDYPTETFIYNPELVINLPDILRETNITWKEVN